VFRSWGLGCKKPLWFIDPDEIRSLTLPAEIETAGFRGKRREKSDGWHSVQEERINRGRIKGAVAPDEIHWGRGGDLFSLTFKKELTCLVPKGKEPRRFKKKKEHRNGTSSTQDVYRPATPAKKRARRLQQKIKKDRPVHAVKSRFGMCRKREAKRGKGGEVSSLKREEGKDSARRTFRLRKKEEPASPVKKCVNCVYKTGGKLHM